MTRARLLSFAGCVPAALPILCWACLAMSCSSEQQALCPDYPVGGIDISAHNGDIDFDAVRADSIDFVLIKATEGGTFKDPAFHDNHAKAVDAGLKVGAYHFFRFETNGKMQALNMLNSVRGRHLDLPLVIDIEEWGNPNTCSTSEIMGRLREMVDYLQSEGYPVMIYTNRDGYQRFVENQLERFPLWLCSFSDPPLPAGGRDVTVWQYSHRSAVGGISGNVDRNVFVGTRQQYEQWLNSLTFPSQYNE